MFLRFGLDIVRALDSDVAIAAPMIIAFLLLSAGSGVGEAHAAGDRRAAGRRC